MLQYPPPGGGGGLPPITVWNLTADWHTSAYATSYDVRVHNTVSGDTRSWSETGSALPTVIVADQYVKVSARSCNANGCTAWTGWVAPTVND